MRKIRTIEELEQALDEDFAWRRKELTSLKNEVKKSKDPILKTKIRTGITLLYAHWEGFIKNSADLYLQYVSLRRLSYQELNTSLMALSLKKKMNEFVETNQSSIHSQFIDYILNNLNERAHLPHQDIINTQSNLSSKVLKEIMHTIGLDYTEFKLKENLIDYKLLNSRNNIAHGQYLVIGKDDYLNLHDEIVSLLVLFKNKINNCAINKLYLNKSS
ncbi:MAE_28990/MAE_18760 family HEPN-like nuclease [Pseudalkalibacillus sp. SCS-8]|uniref:MAE_28990/MAE_18760 family HEPN-like nuclease n=1 Tax=Pseudalkalibacillus nanhaiensis TaxID=3115291 RepID=UPI0032DB1543